MRWLVVSATEDEALGVPRDHPGVLDVVIVGVGKVAAAAALAHHLAGLTPAGGGTSAGGSAAGGSAARGGAAQIGVLNVGTAGGLRAGVSGIVRPSTAWAWDFDAAAIRALGVEATDVVELSGGDGSVVASGDLFVASAERRSALAERASIVDMESYAIAWAARARGFPVEAVKWVSDQADEAATTDWPSVLAQGAREIGGYVSAFLNRTS
ncbi:MAG: nucleosidase [Frankia sp.]